MEFVIACSKLVACILVLRVQPLDDPRNQPSSNLTWVGPANSALVEILAVAGVASMLSKSEPKDVQAAMLPSRTRNLARGQALLLSFCKYLLHGLLSPSMRSSLRCKSPFFARRSVLSVLSVCSKSFSRALFNVHKLASSSSLRTPSTARMGPGGWFQVYLTGLR
jgi:hypothetical protein